MSRIGIAGISIESSTFSPHRTGLGDFTVTRGDDLLARYPWITGPGPRPAWSEGVEWVPLLHAVALPGGRVQPVRFFFLAAGKIVADRKPVCL